jgi:hypothetical protein
MYQLRRLRSKKNSGKPLRCRMNMMARKASASEGDKAHLRCPAFPKGSGTKILPVT